VSMARRRPALVFLVRLWPAENGGEPAWRASLESVGSGKKQTFANLDDLFACMRQRVAQANPSGVREGDVSGGDDA
jgi:hypothetical protein